MERTGRGLQGPGGEPAEKGAGLGVVYGQAAEGGIEEGEEGKADRRKGDGPAEPVLRLS